MTDLLANTLTYWLAGGPLLAPIAAVSVAIWVIVLRLHTWMAAVLRNPATLAWMQNQPGLGLTRVRSTMQVLAALTAVAPLLGLLGTVIGMVETFTAVARISGDTVDHVADGIRKALITTQFGLVVAIPGVFGLARLRRLINQIEAMVAAERVMRQAGAAMQELLPDGDWS